MGIDVVPTDNELMKSPKPDQKKLRAIPVAIARNIQRVRNRSRKDKAVGQPASAVTAQLVLDWRMISPPLPLPSH